MHSIALKISVACLLLFLTSHAGADEAKAILERAITAHGGAEKLERTKRGRLKASVDGRLAGGAFQVVWEETFDLPRRYRRNVEGMAGGRAISMAYAVDGTRGWIRHEAFPAQDLIKLEPIPLERHWHAILAQLLLLRNKDTELKFLGEEMKQGRRLAAISARSPRAAADLYFDRATGLLARAVRPLPNLVAGKEAPGEIGANNYDEYKDIQGVQYPMHSKATSAGSSLEIKVASIEFLDEIDDHVFAKPVEAAPPEAPALPEPSTPVSAVTPARWDMRLVVATLAVGSFVAVVWLLARRTKTRTQETTNDQPGT